MGTAEFGSKHLRAARGTLVYLAIYAWIVATALFFFLRFSLEFFHANQEAIQRLLGRH